MIKNNLHSCDEKGHQNTNSLIQQIIGKTLKFLFFYGVQKAGIRILLFWIGVFFSTTMFGQTGSDFQIRAGKTLYGFRTITIDPGPDWKGYYVPEKNGFDLSFSGGIHYKNRIFAGVGAGYIQIGGVQGYTLFFRTETNLTKKDLAPVLGVTLGYSHVRNQYEKGTGTLLFEPALGIRYKVNRHYAVSLITGLMYTQQSLFFPIRLGVQRSG